MGQIRGQRPYRRCAAAIRRGHDSPVWVGCRRRWSNAARRWANAAGATLGRPWSSAFAGMTAVVATVVDVAWPLPMTGRGEVASAPCQRRFRRATVIKPAWPRPSGWKAHHGHRALNLTLVVPGARANPGTSTRTAQGPAPNGARVSARRPTRVQAMSPTCAAPPGHPSRVHALIPHVNPDFTRPVPASRP